MKPLTLCFFALVLVACNGRTQPDQTAEHDGGDVDAGSSGGDVDAGSSGGEIDAGSSGGDLDAGSSAADGSDVPAACVKPSTPAICDPPGGTLSSAFDPVACGVDLNSCTALCTTWFGNGSSQGIYCTRAQSEYLDAGPAGWFVCGCNIP